jgi:hypothetical protein
MKYLGTKTVRTMRHLAHRLGKSSLLAGRQRGQSLIILTFAFLGLIAMMGLALDLGLVYINRVAMKRAIDAATLAGVVELPAEEEAIVRAMDFLKENGYPEANFYVAGCVRDVNGILTDPGEMRNVPNEGTFRNNLLADDGLAPIVETMDTTIRDDFYLYEGTTFDDVNTNGIHDAGEPFIHDASAPVFFLDTRSFQTRTFDESGTFINPLPNPNCNSVVDDAAPISDGGPYGSSNRLRVAGILPVQMNFMQFFGFREVQVGDEAVAQNSSNLDVVIVMDRTGSMQFDTICFDCWRRCGETDTNCSSADRFEDYPRNGRAFPLGVELGATLQEGVDNLLETYACNNGNNGGDCSTVPFITPADPKPITGTNYIIMEAELYSQNASTWDPAVRGPGQGYWVMQRSAGSGAKTVDGSRPAFVRHHPFYETGDTGVPFGNYYSLADVQADIASGSGGSVPRLEYDFIPTWTGDTHIYARVKAFNGRAGYDHNDLHWAVNRFTEPFGNAVPQTNTDASITDNTSSTSNSWNWVKLGSVPLTQNSKHVLRLWAGSTGYAIDRLFVAGTNSWDTLGDVTGSSIPTNNAATPGTAQRFAADKCNPIYGLSVAATDCRPDGYVLPTTFVENLNDPMFGDIQPIRGSKEAIKAFLDQLDPSLDQAGFSSFSTTATQDAQMECLKAAAIRELAATSGQIINWPETTATLGEFDETECSDPDKADGEQPVRFQIVINGVEDTDANGGTDIADGLRRGLHIMGINTDNDNGGAHANDCNWTPDYGNDRWLIGGINQNPASPPSDVTSHCSRGAAATQVIVLLTDGAPNDTPAGDGAECNATPIDPLPYPDFNDGAQQYRCIMYYAQIAGNNGIIVYTIGLGAGADPDLLGAIAEETNGDYYFAPSAAQLNIIFSQILANIYVRLVQ